MPILSAITIGLCPAKLAVKLTLDLKRIRRPKRSKKSLQENWKPLTDNAICLLD